MDEFRGVPARFGCGVPIGGVASGPVSDYEFVTSAERHRLAAGLSQGEAARLAGITTRTLRRLEAEGSEPLFPTIERLARAYDVDPAVFLNEIRADHRKNRIPRRAAA